MIAKARCSPILVGLVMCSALTHADAAVAGSKRNASFDYFYIEANGGGSSGGHAAIRFGEHTYHLQFAPTGFLEMQRARTSDFLTEYALLSNRSIHVSRIGTGAETLQAIRRTFERRYLKQRRELRQLALQAESPAALEQAAGRLPVAGAGYFDRAKSSEAILRLRARIVVRHGADALARRERSARSRLREALMAPGVDLAETLRDELAALTALEILAAGNGLLEGLVVEDGDSSSTLAVGERTALDSLRGSLASRLVEIFDSQRPDWSTPFLVGMARLLAVDASLERGRFVFLDTFPEGAHSARPSGERWRRIGPQLLADAQQRFDRARERVRTIAVAGSVTEREPAYRELDYARLEAAANRLIEWRAGVAEARPMRLARGRLRPQRSSASVALPADVLDDLVRTLRQQQRRTRDVLADRYDYDLVGRNCVSAIFATIDEALAELAGSSDRAAIRAESLRRLGGQVRPRSSLAFIPFVSSRHVRSEYHVIDAFVIASDRRAQLAQMQRTESDLWVHLRESNVLTSTIYERGRDDSLFLFFTEDAVVMRPLYGAFNLAVGLGGSVAGLLWAPFDRGGLLLDSLQGALLSVPELFFVSIRKGSNDYVAPGAEREGLAGDLAFRADPNLVPGSQN